MKGNLNFMIMGDCHLGCTFPAEQEKRAELQMAAFDKAIEMVVHYNISYLFIPGDLFDARSPKKEVVEHVIKSFTSIPSANIIIACGNHDPYTVDSPYRSYKFPKNVFIFKSSEVSFFEFDDNGIIAENDYYYNNNLGGGKKGVRIYGASYEGHFSKTSMFTMYTMENIRLSSDFINIFMMHAKIDPPTQRSPYNPVISKDVIDCGFEIAIVGDGHTQYRQSIFLNSGILYPRGFEDLGKKGVIVGDVTPEGKIRTEFMPIETTVYEQLVFDVSGNRQFTIDALVDDILSKTNKDVCYEVLLAGVIDYNVNIDFVSLQKELSKNLPRVRIKDMTQKKVDLKLFSQEPIFNGLVTKKIWDKVLAKRNENQEIGVDKTFERTCQDALNILLKNSENLETEPEVVE